MGGGGGKSGSSRKIGPKSYWIFVTTATTDVWGGLVGNTNDLSLMVLTHNDVW